MDRPLECRINMLAVFYFFDVYIRISVWMYNCVSIVMYGTIPYVFKCKMSFLLV